MEDLKKIIEELNLNQRKAVELIDGPVMVVAGPGTGKTQILSARIANILTQTDVGSHSILCLTYTDAGARAIQQRLIEMIGNDAYNVSVHTFHSFGAEVIRENDSLFSSNELQPISELEQIQLLREILDELPASSRLKKRREYYNQTKQLSEIFKTIKEQSLEASALIDSINQYISEMPTMEEFIYKKKYKEFKTGDLKQGAITKVTEQLQTLIEVVNLYEKFLQKMADRKRFDFADMLIWVRDAFIKYPNLLLSYRERYLYLLLDEFQDNNGLQAQILSLLAGAEENPNVFIVGDDDQSIYSFQGANYRRMLDFEQTYNPETVVLNMNYRSSQKILDASKALIENNSERLVNKVEGLTKELIASHKDYKDIADAPVIVKFTNDQSEILVVANQIVNMIQEQKIAPEKIAVIYRNHAQAIEIANYLSSKKIPINAVRPADILNEPIIINILTLLNYVNLESRKAFTGEHLLFEILHFNFFNLEPLDIAKFALSIANANLKKEERYWRIQLAEQTKKSQQNQLFEPNDFHTKLKRVHENLEYWIKQAHNFTVTELIEKMIAKGGILSYALTSEQKNWDMQVLKTFFDFVQNEVERNPSLRLSELINDLNLMKELKIRINIQRMYGTSTGVNFTTAHSSKGLEYDHVFMIRCTDKIWKAQSQKSPYGLGRVLLYENPYANSTNEESALKEENRRLFFVAVTRAKKSIQISYSTEKDKASEYVSELETSGTCVLKNQSDLLSSENEQNIGLEFIASQFYQHEDNHSTIVEDALLDRFLEQYRMSVSHLNQYLKCPVSFYYDKVLKVPSAKNKYMGFGTAIHDTLDEWIKSYQKDEKHILWDSNRLCEEFVKNIAKQRDAFTDESFEFMKEYGKEKLINFYNKKASYIKQVATIMTEVHITAEFDGIIIRGVADRLDLNGNSAHLIDYKTGSVVNGINKLKAPEENANEDASFEKKHGGDYWRQLVFYKILVESSTHKWQIDTAEIEFIEAEADDIQDYTMQITQEDIEKVKQQINLAYKGIKAKEFNKGCGDKKCRWCNFQKMLHNNGSADFEDLSSNDFEE